MKKSVICYMLLLITLFFVSCNSDDNNVTTDTTFVDTESFGTERTTYMDTETTSITESAETSATTEEASTAVEPSSTAETVTESETTTDEITTEEELPTEKVSSLQIIPQPKSVIRGKRYARVPAFVGNGDFDNAVNTFVYFVKYTHGITSEIVYDGEADIRFVKIEGLAEEEYRITVSKNAILVEASDEYGAQNAVSTLVQAMTAENGLIKIPECVIEDKPDRNFRSIMFDLARSWHEPSYIYDYIDMCRFYKVRYLHLHFTDAQLYTLPSEAYPELSTTGYSYSADDIKEIVAYAKLRGVNIIPEIDVPGHSTNFHRAYPEVFGNHNIICMSETSLTAMETLFTELCELFEDSDYIHIGGDEASTSNWTTCPDCLQSFRDKGFDVDKMSSDELVTVMYAEFINRMAKVVQDHGKTPIVWEGFPASANDLITRDIVVYGWENYYQTTDSLLAAGFNVVNAAWKPMYIVAPKPISSVDEVINWNIFKWGAVHPNSPYLNTPLIIEPTDQVIGAQMLCWGDFITTQYTSVNEGLEHELTIVFDKLPPMIEHVWNVDKRLDADRFYRKADAVDALLQQFFTNIKSSRA